MIIYINEQPKEIPDDINSIGKLLDFIHVKHGGTGVGHNSRLVKASEWDSTFISNNDRVLIISATYGG